MALGMLGPSAISNNGHEGLDGGTAAFPPLGDMGSTSLEPLFRNADLRVHLVLPLGLTHCGLSPFLSDDAFENGAIRSEIIDGDEMILFIHFRLVAKGQRLRL